MGLLQSIPSWTPEELGTPASMPASKNLQGLIENQPQNKEVSELGAHHILSLTLRRETRDLKRRMTSQNHTASKRLRLSWSSGSGLRTKDLGQSLLLPALTYSRTPRVTVVTVMTRKGSLILLEMCYSYHAK